MEEKLYFRPAKYGKGLKKHKEKSKEPGKAELKKGDKNHPVRNFVILMLALATIIAVVIWLLRGKTATTGQYPANVRNESLICETKNLAYEKVNNVNSGNKELKISMIFADTNLLSSASLSYTLRFASYSEAHSAEAVSHAQFNLGLQALGYDASKFNNKFSIIGNDLVITLNLSSKSSLDEATRGYFLVNYKDGDILPSTLAEYRQNYETQGFTCTSTTNN